MLSPKEAEKELSIGEQLNPGPWIKHSRGILIDYVIAIYIHCCPM